MPGDPGEPSVTTLVCFTSPGIPHALCFLGRMVLSQLGRIAPRDYGAISVERHCEEQSDEAIHSFFARRDGLLRWRSQ